MSESEAAAIAKPDESTGESEKRKDPETLQIREAQVEDASTINDLANSVALAKLEKEAVDISKTGFLVSGYGPETYADFIKRVDYFFVLEVGGVMRAFLLAYSSEHIIDAKEELNAHIRDTVCSEFVLIKQICTHPDCMGKGYAQALYSHVYTKILEKKESVRPIYTVIVEKPLNPRSISFHEKAGFTQVVSALLEHIAVQWWVLT